MSVLARVAAIFVEPSDEAPLRPAVEAPGAVPAATAAGDAIAFQARAPSVALLCTARQAPALGAAVGLALLEGRLAPCALVATWTGLPAARRAGVPARPVARRAAAGLTARGHAAAAAGRLVRVDLAADEREAAAEAMRLLAAAAGAPALLVLAGPRGQALDELVAGRDRVLVALPDEGDRDLGELAISQLGERARLLECPLPALSAVAARTGLMLPAALRSSVEPGLDGLW